MLLRLKYRVMLTFDQLLRQVVGYRVYNEKVTTSRMSARSLANPSHCVAILMSAEGRFLECRNCLLRVQFASGAHYEVIVQQFESHPCGPLISIPEVAIG